MRKTCHVVLTSQPERVDALVQYARGWPGASRLAACAFEVAVDAETPADVIGDGAAMLQARALGLDYNVVAADRRKKRLLVADMESTIIEQEMLDELAGEIGLKHHVAAITERAMRGELDFEAAIRERVALLAGLDAGVLDELAATRITYMPGARELVATMKANGAYCALVSGGFTAFTAKVAAELGFDEHRANQLEIADGKLTGRVVEPILGRAAKRAALTQLMGRLTITRAETMAVGDGANDLAMLEAAGLGVAFRAKPTVRDTVATLAHGAVVTHCDLTALLYLQGYRDVEFHH